MTSQWSSSEIQSKLIGIQFVIAGLDESPLTSRKFHFCPPSLRFVVSMYFNAIMFQVYICHYIVYIHSTHPHLPSSPRGEGRSTSNLLITVPRPFSHRKASFGEQ